MMRFIDLFAGLGGTRIGFAQACDELALPACCVFSSEIKAHAIKAYQANFADTHSMTGDITQVLPANIPDFDFLLAGFPCQPFSSAGNRHGFMDERGGLFFTILRILQEKKPLGFLLENVDGLVNHDGGNTLKIILAALNAQGYQVNWRVLDASDFAVPQKRQRIYIVGRKDYCPDLSDFPITQANTGDFIDYNSQFTPSAFGKLLAEKFNSNELHGKAIKDKRGGERNIHSWELELKGKVTKKQAALLSEILKKRRNKKWAAAKGIEWMDGMPLTVAEIRTFLDYPDLEADLNYLHSLGYLAYEHPKQRVKIDGVYKRVPKTDAAKGYNIVSGKLSFPFTQIIDPNKPCPTIVATEAGKIAVATPQGVRAINVKEGLAFSGFPANYQLEEIVSYKEAFDLLGNTVMPPVIKAVAIRLLQGVSAS